MAARGKNKRTENFSQSIEKQFAKLFLLCSINSLLHELFEKDILQARPTNSSSLFTSEHMNAMEPYFMDNIIIQLVIRGILEGGEYSLSGLAHYTRIPFDVVLDATCGQVSSFSITAWSRLAQLYFRSKPTVSKMLLERLLAAQGKDPNSIFDMLTTE